MRCRVIEILGTFSVYFLILVYFVSNNFISNLFITSWACYVREKDNHNYIEVFCSNFS